VDVRPHGDQRRGGRERGDPERGEACRVLVGCTGGEPELLKTIPITRKKGEARRVVLSLGRGDPAFEGIPDIEPGDQLDVYGELQVTTDAPTKGPGSVGSPYRYDPTVRACLLLASGADVIDEAHGHALQISGVSEARCSHREHHHVIVFDGVRLRIPRQERDSWVAGKVHVNLVLDAHHEDAKGGDVLLVGQNEPDGRVLGDQARLSVLRFRRGEKPAARRTKTSNRRAREIPVESGRRTVVYSQRLERLTEGEQLLVRVRMRTSSARLSYPARVSTRVFLADDESEEDPGGRARDVAAFRGQVSKLNGFNCAPGESPCTTVKVGALLILKSAGRPLFVNVVAVSADPFGGAGHGDAVAVLDGGFLEVTRYPADVKG
jgi:hypothetical protein